MIKLLPLIILGIVSSGYIFRTRFHLTKFITIKDTGQHLFFKSFAVGILLWLVSLIIFVFSWPIAGYFDWFWQALKWFTGDVEVSTFDFRVSLITIQSLMLALVLPTIIMKAAKWVIAKRALKGSRVARLQAMQRTMSKDKKSEIRKLKKNLDAILKAEVFIAVQKENSQLDITSEFSNLFLQSADSGFPIAFTLSNRKVYIGYMRSIPFGHVNDISITPIISGYRNADNLKLVYVTPYEQIQEVKNNSDKFAISIPIREIIHANLHDISLSEKFQKAENIMQAGYRLDMPTGTNSWLKY